jgi:hypothetical protein
MAEVLPAQKVSDRVSYAVLTKMSNQPLSLAAALNFAVRKLERERNSSDDAASKAVFGTRIFAHWSDKPSEALKTVLRIAQSALQLEADEHAIKFLAASVVTLERRTRPPSVVSGGSTLALGFPFEDAHAVSVGKTAGRDHDEIDQHANAEKAQGY